ncbi:hypothetical protein [Streptomyces sp. AK02-01A]|uniref:hypothetical protein n=1 Tax=Streptomyces sp. AK02-01A TaxID=3028648 RepID=UPI0029BA1455|nr:hypothetical protein [Streptomyces sp. AK02-01A]MDX3852696.1 hypothetical protein [Streptomyces sp. AK02-01A]
MVSGAHTAQNIENTAERLKDELIRLAAQKQALERELTAVVAHLGSVEAALHALQDLISATTYITTSGAQPASPKAEPPVAAVVPRAEESDTAPSVSAAAQPEAESAPPQSVGSWDAEQPDPRGLQADVHTDGKYGRLTGQIMDYFARAGDIDVRARDVAAALRRDTDAGSINAVRSTLDRLVGASRIRRTGRGLYRANP